MRKDLRRSPAIVNVTVSWFVPKPHTPLQWAPQPAADYFHRVRGLLANLARRSRLPVRLKFHDVQRSVLEAALARGDRRLGTTIQAAWQRGARFDAWDDSFDPAIWTQAFDQTANSPAWYAHRARSPNEVLPWSHLAAGPPTDYLRRRYRQLLTKLPAPDAASPDAAPTPGTP
jgi:hypothetical protein